MGLIFCMWLDVSLFFLVWSGQLGLTRSTSESWVINISANISEIAKSWRCKKALNGIIIAQLNVNSLRNKLDLLVIKLKEMLTFLSFQRLKWMNHFLITNL